MDYEYDSDSQNSTRAQEDIQRILVELEVDDQASAIEAIRVLKARSNDSRNSETIPAKDELGAVSGDARKMLEKFRAFSSKIDSLNGTIASMEDQLRHLYADRERLEREIGASEVDDVVAAFTGMYTTLMHMESQLVTHIADREYLDVELGKSEPAEIVAMFRNVSSMIQGAHHELALATNGA